MEHRPVMHCPRCGGSKDKRNTTPSQTEHFFFFTLKAWFKWWDFCLYLTYKKHMCCPQLRMCRVKQASEPQSIQREPPTCRESRSHFANEVQHTWMNGHGTAKTRAHTPQQSLHDWTRGSYVYFLACQARKLKQVISKDKNFPTLLLSPHWA